MSDIFESDLFALPAQVRKDLANRLKETKSIQSLELHVSGDAMEGAKEFSRMLVALRKRGVRISHHVSIRLDFPRPISRDRALLVIDRLPKPKNGSLKVRVQMKKDLSDPAS